MKFKKLKLNNWCSSIFLRNGIMTARKKQKQNKDVGTPWASNFWLAITMLNNTNL